MTVTVLLFASLRERLGTSSLTRTYQPGTTAGELLTGLHAEFPALEASGRVAIAVNSEYAEPQQVLKDGDEVALIPPVSGGNAAGQPSSGCLAPAEPE